MCPGSRPSQYEAPTSGKKPIALSGIAKSCRGSGRVEGEGLPAAGGRAEQSRAHRALRDDADGAVHGEAGAAAEADAVDEGDDGLAHAGDLVVELRRARGQGWGGGGGLGGWAAAARWEGGGRAARLRTEYSALK